MNKKSPKEQAISTLAESAIGGSSIVKYDYVIKNVTVVDGTGVSGYTSDLAISADRIAKIGNVREQSTNQVDGSGLYLAPGFIDVHTHDDIQVLKDPAMLAKISQGVTTVVVGNCGISASPVTLETTPPDPMNILGGRLDFAFDSVSKYAEAVYQARPATNVAALVGHTSLRVGTMDSLDRPASQEEIDRMCEILDQALGQGALGLSTGLAYATAKKSTTDEVIQLAKVVNKHSGVYTTHLRDEYDNIIEAMEEAFEIGREAGVAVIISHFKCAGKRNWGRSEETIPLLSSVAVHSQVACDCYPYTASSSTLDLGQITDDYEIFITWSESYPDLVPASLQAIASKWGVSRMEAARRLQPGGAVYHNMHESDVKRVLSYDGCMIGSDGLPNDEHPHPRLWGTFPRVLGKYAREEKLFSVEEAVRKMTKLPSINFGLNDRGEIKEGNYADLVLFDPDRVIDTSSYTEPTRRAEGVVAVWVNGKLSYDSNGEQADRAGRMLTTQKTENTGAAR